MIQGLGLVLDTLSFEPPKASKRLIDAEFEQKRLLVPELLELINRDVKKPYRPVTEMQLKCRMWDANFRTARSWYEMLADLKQAKNPGACWNYKTSKR